VHGLREEAGLELQRAAAITLLKLHIATVREGVKQFQRAGVGGDLVSVLKADAAEPVAPFIARSKLSTRTITVDNGEVVYGQGSRLGAFFKSSVARSQPLRSFQMDADRS
jgi:hypothetical protein